MRHKTMIDGVAYEVSGGKTLIGGTAYSIKNGNTLIGGTAYEVAFGPEFVTVYDFGTLTAVGAFGEYRCEVLFDTLPFDPATCNAVMVDGVVYEAEYSETSSSYFFIQYLKVPNDTGTSYLFDFRIGKDLSTGKWSIFIYCPEGTYDFAVGTIQV